MILRIVAAMVSHRKRDGMEWKRTRAEWVGMVPTSNDPVLQPRVAAGPMRPTTARCLMQHGIQDGIQGGIQGGIRDIVGGPRGAGWALGAHVRIADHVRYLLLHHHDPV